MDAFFQFFYDLPEKIRKNEIQVDGEEGDPGIDPDLSGQDAAPDFGVLPRA